ncbi:ESX secretion-associated protein EspG [Nocardia australiensis]|uniref:ESX secretion-associated protein EspG n=1 Tax=Nocardia australiensis TaxID=2887191 RepID=UPI001D14E40C|nr:ESX secretion-associated protein EspG [Nocardia australiensis]
MSRAWKFTDLEFLVLWEGIEKDSLPMPLSIASNLSNWDELNEAKAEAKDRVWPTRDGELDVAMAAIARPDIRVVLAARAGDDPEKPEGSIRILGVRRAGRGYVVKQLPGETVWHSAGFVITECDAIKLADAVVQELPEAPAGTGSGIVLVPDRRAPGDATDYSYGRSRIFDSPEESVRSTSAQFLDRPASTVGAIEIRQGDSRFGPRGVVRRRLHWRDVIDDGRYAITTDTPPTASGVDARRLTAMINIELATVVRAIRDERA